MGSFCASSSVNADAKKANSIVNKLHYRAVHPTDIARCHELEAAGYPPDEAASKSSLQYRQHHAAQYFIAAVVPSGSNNDGGDENEDQRIVGYICGTRCHEFTHDSMSGHVSHGALLAIHSVCVDEHYRRQGIATALLQHYVQHIAKLQEEGRRRRTSISSDGSQYNGSSHGSSHGSSSTATSIEKLVLLAKAHLLTFYIHCGFSVVRPSPIVHGTEQWYELELSLSCDESMPPPIDNGEPLMFAVLDAFCDPDQPCTGNQAAIVMLRHASDDIVNDAVQRQWMQNVATEFNFSETAFVWPWSHDEDHERTVGNPTNDVPNQLHYSIRYFTPLIEVPLCGHATLAAAAHVYQSIPINSTLETDLVLHASQDVLVCSNVTSGPLRSRISMQFPVKPATELMKAADIRAVADMVQAAFGISAADVVYTGVAAGIGDVLVELTPAAFATLGYDGLQMASLAQWDGYSRGVILCCVAGPRPLHDPLHDSAAEENASSANGDNAPVDFYSRFFGPKAGIAEDPVTGSAHCVLAPHFCQKLHKRRVVGKQQSRRTGIVECELLDDNDSVRITGMTVTTLTGKLLMEP